MSLFCFRFLECALLLLAHNAPVKIKNAQGWSPLAEAISYGDRQMSRLHLLVLKLGYPEKVVVFLQFNLKCNLDM